MIRIVLLSILFLSQILACRKPGQDISLPESDQLYRTWRLARKLYDGQVTTDMYPEKVTFPRDGKFVKEQDTKLKSCCAPVRFEGNGTIIRFIWDTSDPVCALIDCAGSQLQAGVDWHITTLTDTSLVLSGGKTVLEFVPEP
jgi:hypothetical protein